jgi:uncharacterized phage protein (TIGR01671 family)
MQTLPKFRAWLIPENRMVYDFHWLIGEPKMEGTIIRTFSKNNLIGFVGKSTYVHDFIVMQRTHEQDKNKRDISAEDVVKVPAGYFGDNHYKEALGIVKWNGRGFYIESENWADDYDWNELEVIGNTFENPELFI